MGSPACRKRSAQSGWRTPSDRKALWEGMRADAELVEWWLRNLCPAAVASEIGLSLSTGDPKSIDRGQNDVPEVTVHSVRHARRITESGEPITDMVIEILQRRRGFLDKDDQQRIDRDGPSGDDDDGDFTFRGGCTLLVDPATGVVRYAINKHILSENRLEQHRNYILGIEDEPTLRATYLGSAARRRREPFAMLHRPIEEPGR